LELNQWQKIVPLPRSGKMRCLPLATSGNRWNGWQNSFLWWFWSKKTSKKYSIVKWTRPKRC
jgi:hypothetical protein